MREVSGFALAELEKLNIKLSEKARQLGINISMFSSSSGEYHIIATAEGKILSILGSKGTRTYRVNDKVFDDRDETAKEWRNGNEKS